MAREQIPDHSFRPLGIGRRPSHSVLAFLLVVAVSAAVQWLGYLLWFPPGQVAPIWLPGAVMVSLLLLSPRGWWPMLLMANWIGETLCFTLLGGTFIHMAAITVSLPLCAAGIAIVYERLLGRPVPLSTLRDLLRFYGVSLLVMPVSIVVMVWARELAGYRGGFWTMASVFALAGTLGLVSMPPVALAARRDYRRLREASSVELVEGLVLAATLIASAWLVFGQPPAQSGSTMAMLYVPLLWLLWAALRFGVAGAGGAILITSIIASWHAARGRGPFLFDAPAANMLAVQTFLLTITAPLAALSVVIAERERAAAALGASYSRIRGLTGRVIHAQEQERARIGAELHDDLGQQAASLSMALGQLATSPDAIAPARLAEIEHRCMALTAALRHASHELHPRMLQFMGLGDALESRCDRFRLETGIGVRLSIDEEFEALPPDLALCLYRVTQEGLQNISRHARASQVVLTVEQRDGRVSLSLADNGCGFVAAMTGAGLGHISLDERVSHLGGRFDVTSTVGRGTTVTAIIPMAGA